MYSTQRGLKDYMLPLHSSEDSSPLEQSCSMHDLIRIFIRRASP